MCRDYSVNNYSKSPSNAGWYSESAGALQKVMTTFTIRVDERVRPTFTVDFWTPQYSYDYEWDGWSADAHYIVNSRLVRTTVQLTPDPANFFSWASSITELAGGTGTGTPGEGQERSESLGSSLDGNGRSEAIYKENGFLYAYRNNGYNSNGTVTWGNRTQIGNGWGFPNEAVKFA